MADRELEIGADAIAHVRAAVEALNDPMHVRTLFASILALALREAAPSARMGVAARFFDDALRLIESEEREAA